MGLPKFESCCFCIPLRPGTLILGYLHLIGTLIGIVMSLLLVHAGFAVMTKSLGNTKRRIYLKETYGYNADDISKDATQTLQAIFLLAIGFVLLVLFVTQLVFVIILIIGGHNRKPGFLKAYIVFTIVMLVIAVILSVVSLVTAPSATVVSHFLSYAIEIYFLLVIRSYMIELRDNLEGDRAGKVYGFVSDVPQQFNEAGSRL